MTEHFTTVTLAILVASPVVGSFLGVVIERWPAGRSFLWNRSACDACRHPLGPFDLIPFGSWFLAHGHCRYCGVRLSVFYPLIELAAVIVAIWSALATTGWHFLASCVMGWTLLVVAVIDWREHKRAYISALTFAAWLAWIYVL